MLEELRQAIGTVIWITGLSGAGKSTIGKIVYQELKNRKINAVFLDGDVIRDICDNDLGHTVEDRLINAKRLSKLCLFLSKQGLHVICSTMSLFKYCHTWNRENLKHYYEVYLNVPLEVLKKRDNKEIYSRSAKGKLTGVVGFDLDYDEPQNPDLIIDNQPDLDTLNPIAKKIISSIPKTKSLYQEIYKI